MKIKQFSTYIVAGLIGGGIVLVSNNAFNSSEKIEKNKKEERTSLFDNSKTIYRYVNDDDPNTELPNFVDASQKTLDAVVHIVTEYRPNYRRDAIMEFYWGRRIPETQEASGSGVILTDDGYIITNNHVVAQAESIKVTLNDKKEYTAKVIGADPATDLALLKVEATGLKNIEIGNSDNLQIGEWVLAVGNPFNLNSTVTAGIISAKARNINILEYDDENQVFPIESFIQTDAAVNPGNSGGALVNAKGELVGINTAIASRTGSYSGYSFAIPVNLMQKIADDLLKYGTVQRAYIGVNISNLNQEKADELALKSLEGVYIDRVIEESAADDAGIKEGDIITQINTKKINTVTELQEEIGKYRPGDQVNITFMRNGSTKNLAVTLKNKDGTTNLISKQEIEESQYLGATFKEVGKETLSDLNLKNGVKISSLSSGELRSIGIKKGFIITAINQKKVSTAKEVTDILRNTSGGVLIEGVYPDGTKSFYGLGL